MAEAGEVEKRRMHQCSECGKRYKHEHKLKHHKTWLCKERALGHLWFASMWHKASTCNSPCSARHCSNCPAGKAWFWARRQPPKAAHNIASSRASRWRTSPLWETDGCCAGEHSWALDCLHQAARCLVVCGLCQGSCSPTQPLSVSDKPITRWYRSRKGIGPSYKRLKSNVLIIIASS